MDSNNTERPGTSQQSQRKAKTIQLRIGGLAFLALAGLGSIAFAVVVHYRTVNVPRMAGESRLVLRLDAPYSPIDLRPGADPADVATILIPEGGPDDVAPCQFRHAIRNGTIGILRIGVGDEGMLDVPPLAVWKATGHGVGLSLASASATQSDLGYRANNSSFYTASFAPLFSDSRPIFQSRSNQNGTDAGELNQSAKGNNGCTRIFLGKDLPIDFAADLGFGESSLNLSGLPITNATIETGAARARIVSNEPNPQVMGNCSVRAGLGECTFTGISNLNAKHFSFHGAVGSYHLGFEGHLTQNLDAQMDIGLGICTISIPPTACRVQVFYDDGLLSSYNFSGLVKRRDGYFTSVGFDQSTSPILTLRLAAGAGKMSVNYH